MVTDAKREILNLRRLLSFILVVLALAGTRAVAATPPRDLPPVPPPPPRGPVPLPPCREGWSVGLYFTSGDVTVSGDTAGRIMELASGMILKCAPVAVVIEASADPGEGPRVASARGEAVKAALVARGVPASIVRVGGPDAPLGSGTAPDIGNRRVTVRFAAP